MTFLRIKLYLKTFIKCRCTYILVKDIYNLSFVHRLGMYAWQLSSLINSCLATAKIGAYLLSTTFKGTYLI